MKHGKQFNRLVLFQLFILASMLLAEVQPSVAIEQPKVLSLSAFHATQDLRYHSLLLELQRLEKASQQARGEWQAVVAHHSRPNNSRPNNSRPNTYDDATYNTINLSRRVSLLAILQERWLVQRGMTIKLFDALTLHIKGLQYYQARLRRSHRDKNIFEANNNQLTAILKNEFSNTIKILHAGQQKIWSDLEWHGKYHSVFEKMAAAISKNLSLAMLQQGRLQQQLRRINDQIEENRQLVRSLMRDKALGLNVSPSKIFGSY